MIYRDEQRAIEVAEDLNTNLHGYGKYRAALITEGWTIRRISPYSNGDVLRWSDQGTICPDPHARVIRKRIPMPNHRHKWTAPECQTWNGAQYEASECACGAKRTQVYLIAKNQSGNCGETVANANGVETRNTIKYRPYGGKWSK